MVLVQRPMDQLYTHKGKREQPQWSCNTNSYWQTNETDHTKPAWSIEFRQSFNEFSNISQTDV